MKKLFKRDPLYCDGIPRINIYVMRMFFGLMVIYIFPFSWSHLLTHKEALEPTEAVAWCTWAAYSTLAIIGVYNTVKMLPVMLFMVFYKVLWLSFVAYPLWSANSLAGSDAEELTGMFIWVFIPFLFLPWRYIFKKYILISKTPGVSAS